MKKLMLLLIFSTAVLWGKAQTETYTAIKFDEVFFDFDTLYKSDRCEHSFRFTNTGTLPLIISAAFTNTGAAVCEYSKEPVKPGSTGLIRYRYEFEQGWSVQQNIHP